MSSEVLPGTSDEQSSREVGAGRESVNGAALPSAGDTEWGSDRIAEALVATGVRFIALTPGSSFRGLHDSLVNHRADRGLELLLCTHEEHSVALAHGYTKVTGEVMAVGVHANVGLMHATMAVYNAWCDRIPVLLVGATGPVDASRRRPWIDWIHTSADQGALVRPYVKWDDQPGSVGAAVASIAQAARIARTRPSAPVYVCLDTSIQEDPVPAGALPELSYPSDALPDGRPGPADVQRALGLLRSATNPVLLIGRVDRSRRGWTDRVRLAESLGATVITDAKLAAAFPTTHPLHASAPSVFLDPTSSAPLREADAILALDWLDLPGTLDAAGVSGTPLIVASIDQHLHNGWSKDAYGPAPDAVHLPCTADVAVEVLLEGLGGSGGPGPSDTPRSPVLRAEAGNGPISVPALQTALWDATRGTQPCLIRTALAWDWHYWPIEDPLDALGNDGGGGIGSGPGMAVGGALALRDTDRLPVAVLGDGDTLMGGTALWTAVKHDIPLLVVVANNASFYNDEVHQRSVATRRGRPVENATVGVSLDGPTPDLAAFAVSLGLTGIGPITSGTELRDALDRAIELVRAGGQVLLDVRVDRGYAPALSSALDDGQPDGG